MAKRGKGKAPFRLISNKESLANKMQTRAAVATMFRKENKNQNKI